MEEVEIQLEYAPREVFEAFHDRTERWAVIVAHRRCGKTVACINDLIFRALTENKDDARYAYVAPYYGQAKTIAWDYLIRFSEPVRAAHNQSELWIELINGAKIRLFGADNPDALRGLYLDGVVCDEYADMKPRIWGEVVRPLLADRKGWAVFIGTPKGHNSFYDIYEQATQRDNWYVKVLRASQTGLLPDEELADARSSMSQDQYLQEFECDFESAILGAYYGKEMRQLTDLGRVCKVDYDPMFPVHTAWDLGYSDDTAIWWFQVVHGELRILEYHSSNGQPVAFYTGLINSKNYNYGTHWLPHDARAKTLASGGKSVIEQISDKIDLKSLKIVPNLSIQDGIQATRLALMRAWFDIEKTMDGIECLRQYQRDYDDDKKVFRDKPRHDWTSHGADAFRMLAIAWREDDKMIDHDKPIKGITVGNNEVTMDEMWASTPKPSSGRI
ncbi:Terminase-like family [uncultured Caudovirales phage]|uniref:Terminase-like family n=1 Tax=uncultured Caudovirales phage TaxID=2100421 RepID=A0A6J5KLG7_9CAUD|nr:Terminase-like family [uncultured Caudovirales phage]